jgi:hypothetical protein
VGDAVTGELAGEAAKHGPIGFNPLADTPDNPTTKRMHSPGQLLNQAGQEAVRQNAGGKAADTVLDEPRPLERTHANVAQAVEEPVLLDSRAESGPLRVVNRPPDVDGVATPVEFVG